MAKISESVHVHTFITQDCPLYDNDDVMADFGRTIIDQYIGWVNKHGRPEGLLGWASFCLNSIENMIEEKS